MAVQPLYESGPERLPPHNTAAEEAVLGSILIEHASLNQLAGFLRPEDFYRERNGVIYAAMLALHERREPVDYLTLADELQRQEKYEAAGGLPYLASLVTVMPTAAFAEHYGRFVDLDKITGGFQRSDLVILAARPSLGKTSLALNIGANAATRFHATVAIFSLEMSAWQLAARLLSMEAGIDSARLRLGRLNAD